VHPGRSEFRARETQPYAPQARNPERLSCNKSKNEPRNFVKQRGAAAFQHQGAKPPRLGLRQQAHHVRVGVVELQVDVGDVGLAGDGAGDLFLGDEAVFDEHPAKLAAGAFLVGQRQSQLLFGLDPRWREDDVRQIVARTF
jgi:hypothetical protein